jgi:hypothetical protein
MRTSATSCSRPSGSAEDEDEGDTDTDDELEEDHQDAGRE